MIDHAFDDVIDGLTYCSRCGVWDGAAPFGPCRPRTTTEREQLITAIIGAGKAWWTSARAKANHARMSTMELNLWKAIRALKKHDRENV